MMRVINTDLRSYAPVEFLLAGKQMQTQMLVRVCALNRDVLDGGNFDMRELQQALWHDTAQIAQFPLARIGTGDLAASRQEQDNAEQQERCGTFHGEYFRS